MRIGFSKQFALVTGLACTAGAVWLAGCAPKSTASGWQANGTPVHNDPNEPWWNYQLVYHPNSGVYFEPYSHTWHWQEDGEWRSSHHRPAPVAWRSDEAVVVRLNWETPEFGHTTISALHPQMRMWNRAHPITVPSTVGNDTALTKESADEVRDIDEIFTITPPSRPSTALSGVTSSNSPE